MKCPFYNSHTACTTHPDCLFLRNGGCAIVLAPQIAEQNQREIKSLQSKLKAGNGYASTSFQTAWAMLGLMAAGEVDSPEVRRGAEYLICTQKADGFWNDDWFTAPGFPRVFHLKYHGYTKYFPLWALARYRNLRRNKSV